MKNERNDAPMLPRGRIVNWTREQLDKLSTADLRSLRANAEGRKETEVVALCDDILGGRPKQRGRKSP
jgi:hypothetical protein